ncbi:hypothetical protein PPERSA_07907 [Pseudocohnilembus persalinus]|uniref:Uncharacterized protein n=1 Tax=Pseudocohnilembus persalinus TaxID=266149 RepID=A0A0V0QWX9_PSEPJ|nr:hypothetical protein PPERSA_07907 [Pseudocohnilembus persalinus]|eukprot:KRX06673.1 hypothetical protein PPERSA_07907 [Pseudocohnilembus persalinus]
MAQVYAHKCQFNEIFLDSQEEILFSGMIFYKGKIKDILVYLLQIQENKRISTLFLAFISGYIQNLIQMKIFDPCQDIIHPQITYDNQNLQVKINYPLSNKQYTGQYVLKKKNSLIRQGNDLLDNGQVIPLPSDKIEFYSKQRQIVKFIDQYTWVVNDIEFFYQFEQANREYMTNKNQDVNLINFLTKSQRQQDIEYSTKSTFLIGDLNNPQNKQTKNLQEQYQDQTQKKILKIYLNEDLINQYSKIRVKFLNYEIFYPYYTSFDEFQQIAQNYQNHKIQITFCLEMMHERFSTDELLRISKKNKNISFYYSFSQLHHQNPIIENQLLSLENLSERFIKNMKELYLNPSNNLDSQQE